MAKKEIKCTIRRIMGELTTVDSRNSQKVVAEAAWGDANDTINIRSYNVQDEMLLKGISLTHEEAANLAYILLSDQSIPIDSEKVKDIIEVRDNQVVDVAKVVEDDTDTNEEVVDLGAELADDDDEEGETRTVGHMRMRVRPDAPTWAKRFSKMKKWK